MPGTNQRYTLPDWIENLSFEHALKLLFYGAFGSTAPTGTGLPVTGGTGGGTVTTNPATYNVSSRSQVTVNGATLLIAASASPRKVDFINVNAIPVWISRGTTTNTAGRDYYLAQYGVLSVDEPTTDAFSACTETADNAFVNVVQRSLAP